MTKQELTDKVRESIAEHLHAGMDRVNLQANLVEDLGADSLDCIEIVMMFEDTFSIVIPDAVADRAKTVGDVVDALYERLNPRGARVTFTEEDQKLVSGILEKHVEDFDSTMPPDLRLAMDIAKALFTDGSGAVATRLEMKAPHPSSNTPGHFAFGTEVALGGWCFTSAVAQIRKVLESETRPGDAL